MIVVILISVCAVVFNGVSPLITTLFSSGTTLLVFCGGGGGGCDGLLVVLGIKPGVCGLGGCSLGAYGLSI